jgi:transcription elongation factor Elf1
LAVLMDPTPTFSCPRCGNEMFAANFVPWGAQAALMTATCTVCDGVVTLPSTAHNTVDLTATPIGRGLHGTTRDERERETLVSRPQIEAT